jgi:hypothetical protein
MAYNIVGGRLPAHLTLWYVPSAIVAILHSLMVHIAAGGSLWKCCRLLPAHEAHPVSDRGRVWGAALSPERGRGNNSKVPLNEWRHCTHVP